MSTTQPRKAYKGLAMEGLIARWHSSNTGKNIEEFKKAAQDIAHRVPSGNDVLEVAPGPGFQRNVSGTETGWGGRDL